MRWNAAQLQRFLLMLLKLSLDTRDAAQGLFRDRVPLPDGRVVSWDVALEEAGRAALAPDKTWLRTLALAALWLSWPARYLVFGDHGFLRHELQLVPVADGEVRRLEALLQRHFFAWVEDAHCERPADFVYGFYLDWRLGTPVEEADDDDDDEEEDVPRGAV